MQLWVSIEAGLELIAEIKTLEELPLSSMQIGILRLQMNDEGLLRTLVDEELKKCSSKS